MSVLKTLNCIDTEYVFMCLKRGYFCVTALGCAMLLVAMCVCSCLRVSVSNWPDVVCVF